ncbi:MAG: sulfite exporter TauE/SafE family protein [Clostridia bacterium]|nr:sulfite exporter TauE/SafE family protein [Clostridia bacterium]MDD4047912.1 sulfite exporter TauE/SafE family protein [Clostridia bacterium]
MIIYIIGFFMGILSGLAIGGGTLLIPSLVIFMNISQHTAQGVCLASFIPTAIVAVITHIHQNNVKIRLALYLTLGALIGAVLGATLANHINPFILKKIFGVFLILMGIYQFLGESHT